MWFQKEKILFACNKCGECCRDMDIPLTHYDIWRIICREKADPHDFITFKPASQGDIYAVLLYCSYQVLYLTNKESDNSCNFLTDNQCTIYNSRPNSCHTFPFYKSSLNRLHISVQAEEMVNSFCDKKKFRDVKNTIRIIDKGILEVLEFEKFLRQWNREVADLPDKQTITDFIKAIAAHFNLMQISAI